MAEEEEVEADLAEERLLPTLVPDDIEHCNKIESTSEGYRELFLCKLQC